MSDKNTDMKEVRELWKKEQDKKEEAAINQAAKEMFEGMKKPEDSTPIKPKAEPVFAKPGAPSVDKFSRKLFDGGRKKRKSRRQRRKTKRKTKKRKKRKRKKRKTKKRYRNQRGCKR